MSVYFIIDETRQCVKIGYAENAAKRVSQIQVSSPGRLSMEAVIPGKRADEAALHEALKAHHKRGEWFHRSELVRMIIEKAIRGCTAAELVAFANAPEPADDNGLRKARRKLQYLRWVNDPSVPEQWRNQYREWLREDYGIIAITEAEFIPMPSAA